MSKGITLSSFKDVKHSIIPYALMVEGYLLYNPQKEYTVNKGSIDVETTYSSPIKTYKDEYCKVYKKVEQDRKTTNVCDKNFSNVFIPEGSCIRDDEDSLHYGIYSKEDFPVNPSYFKYWLYDEDNKLSAFSNTVYALCKYFEKDKGKFNFLILDIEELKFL